jgi:hypothetical protein
MSDCIRPIMLGTPKRQATALPQIDPQIVAACKERDPNFGKGGRRRDQAAVLRFKCSGRSSQHASSPALSGPKTTSRTRVTHSDQHIGLP